MRVGFTGSRNGMTAAQRLSFEVVLSGLRVREFHHGDCVGADEQAAEIAKSHGAKVVAHPPTKAILRAYSQHNDEALPALSYLDRNRAIVNWCHVLVATPGPQSTGTMWTVRYARQRDVPTIVIHTDGKILRSDPKQLTLEIGP